MWLRIFTNTLYLSWSTGKRKLDCCCNNICSLIQNLNPLHWFITVLISESSSFELINLLKIVCMIFVWVIKITAPCWCFLISRLITFGKTFSKNPISELYGHYTFPRIFSQGGASWIGTCHRSVGMQYKTCR